jgi:uncharacterized RDD family membrane protein YckC
MRDVPERGSQPAPNHAEPSGEEDVLGRRIGAALIDLALLVGLFIVVALAIGDSEVEEGSVSLSLSGGAAAAYFGLVLLYYFAFEAAIGQTPGKLLLGLQVVRADLSRPSVGAIALRTLFRIADWLPFFYLFGFITMMVTGRRRRRIGDLAAKTDVKRSLPMRRRGLALPPIVLLLLLLVALSVYRAADSDGGRTTDSAGPTRDTIRLSPTGAILFRDGFSNRRSGWYVGRDRSQSSAYVNGRYRIVIRDAAGYWTVHSNHLKRASAAISVAAVLRQSVGRDGDEFGVVCVSNLAAVSAGSAPRMRGYALGIEPDKGFLWMRETSDADVIDTFGGGESRTIKQRGGINRIRADCVGARGRGPAHLTAYTNGKLVADEVVPGGYKIFDGIAFYVYSDRGHTTILFDDVVVRELKRPTSPYGGS